MTRSAEAYRRLAVGRLRVTAGLLLDTARQFHSQSVANMMQEIPRPMTMRK
jgi:hypothetical protein